MILCKDQCLQTFAWHLKVSCTAENAHNFYVGHKTRSCFSWSCIKRFSGATRHFLWPYIRLCIVLCCRPSSATCNGNHYNQDKVYIGKANGSCKLNLYSQITEWFNIITDVERLCRRLKNKLRIRKLVQIYGGWKTASFSSWAFAGCV